MGLLSEIFSGGAAKLAESVTTGLDSLITSKEEKEAAKLAIQEAINKHIQTIEAESTKRLELELKDIDSARNREIQIATSEKAPLINKIILPLMAAFVTLGFFGILSFMLFREVPKDNETILNIMLGSLGTAWIGIVSYFFGSSAGSAAKQKQMDKIINEKM